MYNLLEIRNFKCFKEFSYPNLKRINLITGINNIGKTALLEAFFIHCGLYNPSLIARTLVLRGLGGVLEPLGKESNILWDPIFLDYNLSKEISILGQMKDFGNQEMIIKEIMPDEQEQIFKKILDVSQEQDSSVTSTEIFRILKLTTIKNKNYEDSYESYIISDINGIHQKPARKPLFNASFLQSDYSSKEETADFFSQMEINLGTDYLLEALQIIEPRLSKITLIGRMLPILYGNIGLSRLIPLNLLGNGIVRLTNIFIHLYRNTNGVLLIDEIENGFHYSILEKIWQSINQFSKKSNTQIFATTHSFECIRTAYNAFKKESEYDFSLSRLDYSEDRKKIEITQYDRESLKNAIEFGFEVR